MFWGKLHEWCLGICLVLLLTGCNATELTDLYHRDFGLVQEADVEGVRWEMFHRPLYLLHHNKHKTFLRGVERPDLVEEFGNYLNFNLTLTDNNTAPGQAHSVPEYTEREVAENLVLHCEGQEIKPAFVQLEPQGSRQRFLLSFPSPMTYGAPFSQNMEIEWKGSQVLQFEYDKSLLNKVDGLFEKLKKQNG